MDGRAARRRLPVFVPVALALPLALLVVLGYLLLSPGGGGEPLAVASGVAGTSLHPIAGQFEPDGTKLADCGGRYSCLEQAFGNIAFRQGPKRALALFGSRMATDSSVDNDCHRIAHTIGSASLKRFHGDVARTFALGAATCVSGYYHGILERAFYGIRSMSELARTAASLCRGAVIRRHGFLDYQCRHGLGHGLMLQTGYDLPIALSVCARLGTGWDRRACVSGAFMENVNTRFGFRSQWLDDKDPLYPCETKTVRAFDKRSCYLRASDRVLDSEAGDFAKAAEACARLREWAPACIQGLGRDATEKVRYAPKATRALCRLTGAGESDCLYGAARTIANASGLPGVEPAAVLCDGALYSARARCFSGVGLVLGMLYPTNARRQAACARVAPGFVAACAAAARAEIDPSGIRSWG